MRPTDEQALDALRVVAAWLGVGSTAAPETYDADRLPPTVTRDAYLRRHRARVRDGVAGWSRSGQGRTVTALAWQLDVAEETARTRSRRRLVTPAAANDSTGRVAAALGIVLHRGAR